MQKSETGNFKAVNKNVREISFLLDTIGCKLKRISEIRYQVWTGREYTGLVLIFGKDKIDNKNCQYTLAIMYYPVPQNDFRFFMDQGHDESNTYPHAMAHANNKRAKTLLFEFIFRSIYYYKASKILRKWNCHSCGEMGFEIFLDNGSLATFDSNCNDFSLIIVDSNAAYKGIVYDDLIGEHVLPVCRDCIAKLGFILNDDCDLTVDELYFKRILSKRSETARVMGLA